MIRDNNIKNNIVHSKSDLTKQAVSHIWGNSDISLLSKVCADDSIHRENESLTIKSLSSENVTI